jgi:hypothetical protein
MASSSNNSKAAAREGDDLPAFSGDTGTLSIDARRVLVQLLLGPALDAQRQSKLWPVLLRDERALRSRLHELFLELVVDHDQQVAFTRQVADPEVDVPVLLRRTTLTFIQSALVLFLREQLTLADARGERAVLAREEMLDHLGAYERDDSADRAKFERQAQSAIDRCKELNLLRRLRAGEERYEVSPTLKLLFPAEEIQALMRSYASAAEHGHAGELAEHPTRDAADSGTQDEDL